MSNFHYHPPRSSFGKIAQVKEEVERKVNRLLSMDPDAYNNHRIYWGLFFLSFSFHNTIGACHYIWLMQVSLYAIFVGIVGILVQAIVQLTESTVENKIRLGISLATLIMNFVSSLWVFSPIGDIQHQHWKVTLFKIVFIFTGILSPYTAFYVLLPQWITWHGFAIICIVLTFGKGYNMLQFMFIWFYQKIVTLIKHAVEKFSVLIFRCEVPMDVKV